MRKITGRFLGKITRDGLIKPKHEQVLESLKDITVKEYGATKYLIDNNRDVIEAVKKTHHGKWKEMLSFAVFRLMYNSPIKNISAPYATSYLSETLKDASMSPKPIGEMLRDIGSKRKTMIRFLKRFVQGDEFMVIDGTHMFSFSGGLILQFQVTTANGCLIHR